MVKGLTGFSNHVNPLIHIYRQIKGNYKESILDINSIINELAAGKPLNAEKIISISNTVCCGLHDSYHILRILNEEKELDEYTYTHSLNVALYAMLIGKWLRLDNDSIKNVIKATEVTLDKIAELFL